MRKNTYIFFCLLIFLLPSYAEQVGDVTGLKIPRYVSLAFDEANLRIGSNTNYPIILTYTIINTPFEIIDEYKDWRKIIDFENNIGWIHQRLLKGKRYAIIDPPYEEAVQIFNKPYGNVIGKIGKKNIIKVNKCLKKWCHVNLDKNKGWINKSNLWGVYEKEVFDIPFYQPLIYQFWKININY